MPVLVCGSRRVGSVSVTGRPATGIEEDKGPDSTTDSDDARVCGMIIGIRLGSMLGRLGVCCGCEARAIATAPVGLTPIGSYGMECETRMRNKRETKTFPARLEAKDFTSVPLRISGRFGDDAESCC